MATQGNTKGTTRRPTTPVPGLGGLGRAPGLGLLLALGAVTLAASACKPRKTGGSSGVRSAEDGQVQEIAPAVPELAARNVAPGEGPCPAEAAAEKGLGGCLEVREPGWSRAVALRYLWAAPRRPGKPVVVFLHGGPGGNLEGYSGMDVFRSLLDTHDVLFYDQRGGGLSSPLSGSDARPTLEPEGPLSHLFMAHHLADLEAIRKSLLGGERIVVMGHSFGAHLALAYATTFPSAVSAVIALNGAADATGFVTQSTLRIRMFDGIAEATLGKSGYAKMRALEENGTLRDPDGQPSKGLFTELHPLLYTFEGQTKELPARLLAYARAAGVTPRTGEGMFSLVADAVLAPLRGPEPSFRHSEDASFFPAFVPRRTTRLSLSEYRAPQGPVINDVANQWVVCSSLVTPRAIDKVSEPFRPIPTARRGVRCKDYPAVASTFDVFDKLPELKVPVLLTGGSHDPLIPYSLQTRDFEQISKGNKAASLVVFDDAGHNPDENAPCFGKTVIAFARGTLPAGKVTCRNVEGLAAQ